MQLAGGPALPVALPAGVDGAVTVGLRASALNVNAGEGDIAMPGKVELAEISGSDTFVHVETLVGELVAQLTGVHRFELGAADHAVLRCVAGLRVRCQRAARGRAGLAREGS